MKFRCNYIELDVISSNSMKFRCNYIERSQKAMDIEEITFVFVQIANAFKKRPSFFDVISSKFFR